MNIIKSILLIFALYGTYQQITNDILAITKGGYNDVYKSRQSTLMSALVACIWGIFYYFL